MKTRLRAPAIALLGAVISLGSLNRQEPVWVKVASVAVVRTEDDGSLISGSEYRLTESDISPGLIPGDSPFRNILFGGRVAFRFLGSKPGARYQIRAAFLSDSDSRVESISVNDSTIEDSLTIPKAEILERAWEIPPGIIRKGELTVSIACRRGPNAVVSHLEVFSDDSTKLALPPALSEQLDRMTIPMPHLAPMPVAAAGGDSASPPVILLNGKWFFNPSPPGGFEAFRRENVRDWTLIDVPGEWAMQGFTVEPESSAAYWREFQVPGSWRGGRVLLRFDAVHSSCTVWVNGKEAGGHEGGFTAFEFDITAFILPGMNTLALSVRNESLADVLESATQYAAHQIGGILRKTAIFCVPKVSVSTEYLTSKFDSNWKDATLEVHLTVRNDADTDEPGPALNFELTSPDGRGAGISPPQHLLGPIPAHSSRDEVVKLAVNGPRKWDTEHPNLYKLATTLVSGGGVSESVRHRFGFRTVEVRGNRVFVNNRPVKLHGVCRHEVHPLSGRSLSEELCRADARLFREANVNYIRTSHYPPSEEFLEACDELGIFVECEAALCWVQHGANTSWQKWNYRDPKIYPLLMRANLENVVFNRNHPSVIIWSLANESYWSPLFARVEKKVREADPGRLTSFHDQCWGAYNNGGSRAQVAVYHYPDERGPARCDSSDRPVLFGEYTHIETYNRREGVTDPGIRDNWGGPFERMVNLVMQHDGCLGGAIWSGVDEIFQMPSGRAVGYGPWGIIDGWRRTKPEYWHVKKSYSPVHVIDRGIPPLFDGTSYHIRIENRYDFTNLSEVKIAWEAGGERGTALADIGPHTSGELLIGPISHHQGGNTLRLTFTDPRDFICEMEDLKLSRAGDHPRKGPGGAAVSFSLVEDAVRVKAGRATFRIDRATGRILSAALGKKVLLSGGPVLMVLPLVTEECLPAHRADIQPLNDVCTEWTAASVEPERHKDGSVSILVSGAYREAAGSYTFVWTPDGKMKISYEFTSRREINPRQWGMVFYAPSEYDSLIWDRRAQWTNYPPDHIGRPSGGAGAHPRATDSPDELRRMPPGSWSSDATPLGSNDFRSTKTNVSMAGLRSREGNGVTMLSGGGQSVRAFVDDGRIGFLVADFNTGGGEGFFSSHYEKDRRPLSRGSTVRGEVVLFLKN